MQDAPGPEVAALERMRNEPQLASLITSARQNTASLPSLLEELNSAAPHLVQLIRDNQPDFVALLNGTAPLA